MFVYCPKMGSHPKATSVITTSPKVSDPKRWNRPRTLGLMQTHPKGELNGKIKLTFYKYDQIKHQFHKKIIKKGLNYKISINYL